MMVMLFLILACIVYLLFVGGITVALAVHHKRTVYDKIHKRK